LFKLRDKIKFIREQKNVSLTYNSLQVLELGELIPRLIKEVMSGSVVDDCLLCFETVGLPSLYTSCGKCENLVCKQCITTWFSQTEPGKIVLPPHLLCPFCKQTPKWKVVKRYNKRLAEIIKGDNLFDTKWYCAWCIKCSKVKRCVERVCAEGMPDLGGRFACETCLAKEKSGIKTKNCPSCGTATNKTSGCNHITCPVKGCRAHWCYKCGELFKRSTIYDHMRREHGGFWT